MKSLINKLKNKESGGAIILTLLCLTLLSVISMGFIGISLNQSRISFNLHQRTQLYYLAKSGISRAMYELETNPNWKQDSPETISVGGNNALVQVTVTPSAGNSKNTYKVWTVNSTARMGTLSRTVTAKLESETFARYAMFTDRVGWVFDQDNSPEIYSGPIHSNRYFLFYGHPKFKSPVTSSNINDEYYDPKTGKYNQWGDVTMDPSLFYHYMVSYDNDKPQAEDGVNTFYFAGAQPPKVLPDNVNSQKENSNIAIQGNVIVNFLPSGDMKIVTNEGTFIKSCKDVTLYATGSIQVEGTLKGNVNLVSEDNIFIMDNIVYKDKTLDSLALVAKNFIALYTDEDDVRDIEIDAMMFSLNAGFYVYNYDKGTPRGTIKIFGGLVQKWQFETGIYSFAQRKLVTGYNKNLVFDPRFLNKPPDNVPTTGKIRIKSLQDKASL